MKKTKGKEKKIEIPFGLVAKVHMTFFDYTGIEISLDIDRALRHVIKQVLSYKLTPQKKHGKETK